MGNRRIGLRLTSYQLVVRTYTLNAHLVILPTGDQPAPRSRKKNMARILLQPRAIPFVSGIRSTDTGVTRGTRNLLFYIHSVACKLLHYSHHKARSLTCSCDPTTSYLITHKPSYVRVRHVRVELTTSCSQSTHAPICTSARMISTFQTTNRKRKNPHNST